MTRGAMRTLLRRWIRDANSTDWADADLNEILNLAYTKVQKTIFKSFPEAHLSWDYLDLTNAVSWYPLPEHFAFSHVAVKSSSSDTVWTTLAPKDYADIKSLAGTTQYFTRKGQWIGIFPAPTETITDGIQIVHTPVMTMSDDAEVPKIKVPVHEAIVLWGKLLCLGDTDENSGETGSRLQEILNDLNSWYDLNNYGPDKLQVVS